MEEYVMAPEFLSLHIVLYCHCTKKGKQRAYHHKEQFVAKRWVENDPIGNTGIIYLSLTANPNPLYLHFCERHRKLFIVTYCWVDSECPAVKKGLCFKYYCWRFDEHVKNTPWNLRRTSRRFESSPFLIPYKCIATAATTSPRGDFPQHDECFGGAQLVKNVNVAVAVPSVAHCDFYCVGASFAGASCFKKTFGSFIAVHLVSLTGQYLETKTLGKSSILSFQLKC